MEADAGLGRARDLEARTPAISPLMRAGLCVVLRDLIAYSVVTDMMHGRPAIYSTFSSYDEVAHHSGLERADTLDSSSARSRAAASPASQPATSSSR